MTSNNFQLFREILTICSKNKSTLTNIFKEKGFDVTKDEIIGIFVEKDTELVKYAKICISSTLEQLYQGKFWGDRYISPIGASFREALITSRVYKVSLFRNRGYWWHDTEYNNILSYPLLSNMYPNEKGYSKALIVIPFMITPYPWLFLSENRLNLKAFDFIKGRYNLSAEKKIDEFDGKWRLNHLFDDYRRILRRYVFKEKKLFPDKFLEYEGSNGKKYHIISCKGVDFFAGRTEDYLVLHKKYIEK